MPLDPAQLNRWGNRLTVLADVLLTVAALGEVAREAGGSVAREEQIPLAVKLNVSANFLALLGDSTSAYAAEQAVAVPVGQDSLELARINLAGSWGTLAGAAVAVLAARAALADALAAAQAHQQGFATRANQRP